MEVPPRSWRRAFLKASSILPSPPVQDHIFYYSSDLQDSIVLHPAMSPEIIRQFLNCEKS